MIPGDPFETEALDEMRSQQRRVLWMLQYDRALMQSVGDEQPVIAPAETTPESREWACRRMAADLMSDHTDHLADLEREACWVDGRNAVNAVTGGRWIASASSSVLGRPVPEVLIFSEDKERLREMRDAVLLMRMADVIAGLAP